jgi:hypothetical protein
MEQADDVVCEESRLELERQSEKSSLEKLEQVT